MSPRRLCLSLLLIYASFQPGFSFASENEISAVEKLIHGLLEQRHPVTHLPASHRGHPGQENVYFLYDLAHNAMEFHLAGRQQEAEELLDYVAARLRISQEKVERGKNIYGLYGIRINCHLNGKRVVGILNALDRSATNVAGTASMEIFATPGPNAWLGLAFDMVNPKKYQAEITQVAEALLSMQDPDGGFFDGTRATNRVHVEPHNDAYAFLRNVAKRTNDPRYKEAADRAREWFFQMALLKEDGTIYQGIWEGKPNLAHATDVYTWGIATYIDQLDLPTIKKLVATVEQRSLVRINFQRPDNQWADVILTDFTDPSDPIIQKNPTKAIDGDHRGGYHPLGSAEWTGGFILMYQLAAVKAWELKDRQSATLFKAKAEALLSSALDSLHEHQGGLYGGYSTGRWVATGHGWLTPLWTNPGDGSVASDWLIFPAYRVNPFSPDDKTLQQTWNRIPRLSTEQARKTLEQAVQQPAYVEKGPENTPEQAQYRMEPFFFLTRAWSAFKRGEGGEPAEFNEAIKWASIVPQEWGEYALQEQILKNREVGGLVQTFWGESENNDEDSLVFTTIWKTPLLNEVGSAAWIIATSHYYLGHQTEAKKWVRWIVENVPAHQIHDPENHQYWNALVAWELNPDGSALNSEMGAIYRDVLQDLDASSRVPDDISKEKLGHAYSKKLLLVQSEKSPYFMRIK